LDLKGNRKCNCKNNINRKSNSKGKSRMADYSMNTTKVQRSAGSSAVAHVAYITGKRLDDLRTGQEADYTRRDGVEFAASAIVLPASERETQSALVEREALWNMAEAAEKRKDGNPARKVLVALPHELGPAERQALALEYAQWLADRHGVAVDYAVHRPDKEGDQRNFHAHLVMTTRKIEAGKLSDKSELEWDGARLKKAGLPSGREQLNELRQQWETIQNAHLREYAPEVAPVSCKSLRDQCTEVLVDLGIHEYSGRVDEAREARLQAIELDRTPQPHVGWQATAMERRRERVPDMPMPDLVKKRKMAQAEHAQIRAAVAAIRERIVHVAQEAKQMLEKGLAGFGSKFQEWKQQRAEQAQEQKREIERLQKAWNEPERQARRSGPRRSGRGDGGMGIGD